MRTLLRKCWERGRAFRLEFSPLICEAERKELENLFCLGSLLSCVRF